MSAKRAIERTTLPEAIAEDLRERLLSGEFAVGETIRQEALAREYDVSRMPIREALKSLEAEGLVQLSANRGARVTQHSLEEIREIFDLRILIETDLFKRSIPKMTEAHFARCEALLEEMDASFEAGDVARWGRLNHDFHAALYAAAGRSVTNEFLDRIGVQSDRYVRMHLSVMKQRAPAMREHRDLLALAREGDVERGPALLAAHIRRSRDELIALISGAVPPGGAP